MKKMLLYGNEPYLMDVKIKDIIKESGCSPENINYINGWNPDKWDDWQKDLLKTGFQDSLFGKQAFVVNVEELKEEMSSIFDLKADVYVIAEKVDKRKKIYQEFKKHGIEICNKVDAATLNKFILREVKKVDVQIKEDAFALFLKRMQYYSNEGVNLYTIRTYVRQMAFSVKADKKDTIDVPVVETYVQEKLDEQTYRLTDYLFKRNGEAYAKLAVNLIQEQDGIGMLSAILRTFRVAYKASLYPKKSPKELEKILGVPGYQYAFVCMLPADKIQCCMDILLRGIEDIKQGNRKDLCFLKTMCELWDVVGGLSNE